MDDADLEKLTMKPGVPNPKFDRNITEYSVTLASNVEKIKLDYLTSDSNASSQILNHDEGRTIDLKEGDTTPIRIEVTAEDGGTTKVYQINARRLSAKDATLSGIKVAAGDLWPAFDAHTLVYSCIVPYNLRSIKVTPSVLDKKTTVTVNGQDPGSAEVNLNVGETTVDLEVTSADGSNKVVYTVVVVKQWLGYAIQFADEDHQAHFECPISLAPCYRPVEIVGSYPKHVFSQSVIDELTRTNKEDPLDGSVLQDDWERAARDREEQMSPAIVMCLFSYRGCTERLKYSDLGDHIHGCTYRPNILDEREDTVTCKECSCKIAKEEGDWHRTNICSSKHSGRDITHTVKEHSWQKKLQGTGMGENVDELMEEAKSLCRKYRMSLPRKGQTKKYEMGNSPADLLHSASVNIACAIKQKPKDPTLHYQLGLVMEEQYYAKDLFGITKEDDDIDEGVADLALDPCAKDSSKEDDIQAICQQRGAGSNPSLSRQLQAVDEEYRYLLDSGQSGKADYVQALYVWKSKQATQDGKTAQAASDEETPLGKACLKYLDALSLQQNNVTYNLHAGRVFLLQGRIPEAIDRFQVALGLKPTLPVARLYLGLALSSQKDGPGTTRLKEATQYLHDGVEHVLGLAILRAEGKDRGTSVDLDSENLLRPSSPQILRVFIHLGKFLLKSPQEKFLSPKLVFHSVSLLASQSICDLVHRGDTYQSMEWLILDTHTSLLEQLMKEKASAQWIASRCQYISAIIKISSIPQSQEILQLQEKVCQKGVIAQPTNSHVLYLLGNAQLAMYDDASGIKEDLVKVLEDARLSLRASITQEGKPSIGGQTPDQLTKQGWWQQRLKEEEAEKTAPAAASKTAAGTGPRKGAVPARGGPAARGTRGAARGANAGKASTTRGAARAGATRGGTAARGSPTKTVRGKTSSSPSSSSSHRCVASRGGSRSKVTAHSHTEEKGEQKKGTTEDTHQQATPVPANAPLNRMSYQPRLGLARALSKETEDFTEAKLLYNDVIVMAPEVHDAYIELANLLIKMDPLGAVEVYTRYPFPEDATFDDAYLHGEVVRILMKQEQYDDPRLEEHMIAWGRVMGLGCLEKYVAILDSKFKSELLRNIYAGVNRKSVDDPDMQAFFKFKMWL